MISFLVTHPWLIRAGWFALACFISGLALGAALYASRPKQGYPVHREEAEEAEWAWPQCSPTKGETHLGKATVGEHRRAA